MTRTHLALAFAALATGAPGQSLDGTWIGVTRFGSSDWVQLDVRGDSLAAHFFLSRQYGRALRGFQRTGSSLRFTYASPIGEIEFAGKLRGREIRGSLRAAKKKPGTFLLRRFADLSPYAIADVLGVYRSKDKRELIVTPRSYGGLRVVTRGNAVGEKWDYEPFFPNERDKYFSLHSDMSSKPYRLDFGRDEAGAVTSLKIIEGERVVTAQRIASWTVSPTEFQSDGHRLRGFVLAPAGARVPGLVLAHGSGRCTADQPAELRVAIEMAFRYGLAVLRYDKRGSGGSDGAPEAVPFEELARDVERAVDVLQRWPGVDSRRVGIGGVSQSPSFVLPIVASRRKVAFVIALLAQVGDSFEADLFNLENRMSRAGFTEKERTEALAFMRAIIPFMIKTDQRGYEAFISKYRSRKWYNFVDRFAILATPLSAAPIEQRRRNASVNSAELWPKVRCPVYFAWGGADRLVDTRSSHERITRAMRAYKLTNFSLKVYARAGHSVARRSSPGFWSDLGRWLERISR